MKPLFTTKSKRNVFPILVLTLLFMSVSVWSQASERTVGLLINEPGAYDGYNLFYPINNPQHTYLINNAGKVVHTWEYDEANGAKYLKQNGNLLLSGYLDPAARTGGVVREMGWDGTILRTYDFTAPPEEYSIHHDLRELPNGNILMIAEKMMSKADAIAAGANPVNVPDDGIITDNVIEVDPEDGSIVWEWHVTDHLIQDFDGTKANSGDVGENPQLIDINFVLSPMGYFGYPLNRFNALDYNPDLDQIILSDSLFNEIWIIDHSTTTEVARGEAGDLLYRWGNPLACRAGEEVDQKISFQHNVQWIDEGLPGAGHILIFNNGSHLGYSQALEIAPTISCNDYVMNQADVIWLYEDQDEFYGSYLGGIQRLPNGNTLICQGPRGILFEVTPEGDMVWKYANPIDGGVTVAQGEITQGGPSGPFANADVYRVTRYPSCHPGFAGKDLTSGDPIEQYPLSVTLDIRPWSSRNKMKPRKHILFVAVFGTENLDVNAIDPDSIWLESIPAFHWMKKDIGSPDGANVRGRNRPDGLKDLVLLFDNRGFLSLLDYFPRKSNRIKVHLTGSLVDGEGDFFIGSDEVSIRRR